MIWDTLDTLNDDGTWLAEIDRCLLRDCAVRSAIREDGAMWPKWKWGKKPGATLDVSAPSGASGRVLKMQKEALEHLVAHAPAYEARVMAWLGEEVQKVTASALKGDLDGVREWVAKHPRKSLPPVKDQVLLDGVILYPEGWGGTGCISLEFECGWDEEHGLSLLMHKGRTVAASGRADFTGRGTSLLAHAKGIQKWKTHDIALK